MSNESVSDMPDFMETRNDRMENNLDNLRDRAITSENRQQFSRDVNTLFSQIDENVSEIMAELQKKESEKQEFIEQFGEDNINELREDDRLSPEELDIDSGRYGSEIDNLKSRLIAWFAYRSELKAISDSKKDELLNELDGQQIQAQVHEKWDQVWQRQEKHLQEQINELQQRIDSMQTRLDDVSTDVDSMKTESFAPLLDELQRLSGALDEIGDGVDDVDTEELAEILRQEMPWTFRSRQSELDISERTEWSVEWERAESPDPDPDGQDTGDAEDDGGIRQIEQRVQELRSDDMDNPEIGKKLKEEGFEQSAIAEVLDVTQSAVSRY